MGKPRAPSASIGIRSGARLVKWSMIRLVYRIRFGKFGYLGSGVRISLKASIKHPENISIGDLTEVGDYAALWSSPSGRIELGESCFIGRCSTLIDGGGFIETGDRVQIGGFSVITGQGGVRIGDAALFAPNVSIIANQHTFDDLNTPIRDQPEKSAGITIGRNGWLGIGASIMDGVTIGDHVVVGANAVVTKDIPSFSVAVGVPAKVIRRLT